MSYFRIAQIKAFSACFICGRGCSFKTCICQHCKSMLPYHENACIRCGSASKTRICKSCLQTSHIFHRLRSAFWYQGAIKHLLNRFKGLHDSAIGRDLGIMLADEAKNWEQPELVVYLPINLPAYRQQGFCHISFLANVLQKQLKHLKIISYLDLKTQPKDIKHISFFTDVIYSQNSLKTITNLSRKFHNSRLDIWSLAINSINN